MFQNKIFRDDGSYTPFNVSTPDKGCGVTTAIGVPVYSVTSGVVVATSESSITLSTFDTFRYVDLSGNVENPRCLFITIEGLHDLKFGLNDHVFAGDVVGSSSGSLRLIASVKLNNIYINPVQFIKDYNVKQTSSTSELSRSDDEGLDSKTVASSGGQTTDSISNGHDNEPKIVDSPISHRRPKWLK